MSIDTQLREDQKAAMKAGDKATLNVVRSVRAEVATAQAAPHFAGEVDDDLFRTVIATYVKRITKAKAEYDEMGAVGADRAASIAFEIDYLAQYLPQKLDEDETRALVAATIDDIGADTSTPHGKVVGAVMRTGEDLDGALVSRLVADLLSE
ncbi:MAG: GatB/YqeY domain-containing protein [Acidimicrobiia bacterium]